MADEKKPSPIIHLKKFMDGRMSPSDAHATFGLRKKCLGCAQAKIDRPAVVRVRMFAEIGDFIKKMPREAAVVAQNNPEGPFIPTQEMKFGDDVSKMVLISDVGACELCRPELLKQAAKHPDWMFCEIDDSARFKEKHQTQVSEQIA